MKIFQSPNQRLAENKLYEIVATEIERGEMSKGVWAKAIAESGGDEAGAKSIYIKLRVQELADELAVASESAIKAAAAQKRRQKDAAELEERARNEAKENERRKREAQQKQFKEERKRREREQLGNPEYKRHLNELRAANSPGAGDALKWIAIFIVIVALLAIADS